MQVSLPSVALITLFARLLIPGDAEFPPQCDETTMHQYSSGWPKKLDWGVYWYGFNDEFEKAAPPYEASRLYNPTRNTLLFIHGWMGNYGGVTTSCWRQTTKCIIFACGDERLMVDYWISQNWNVGIFYWDQFSDEPCLEEAEQKIWLDWFNETQSNTVSLRWVSSDLNKERTYHQFNNPGMNSVTDLCVQGVDAALSKFQGDELRFLSHSLGTGLTARCADFLQGRKSRGRPTRLTLLDPVFPAYHALQTITGWHHTIYAAPPCPVVKVPHEHNRGTFGASTMRATAKHVLNLWKYGVPTEVYLSSSFSEDPKLNTPIRPLEPLVVLVQYLPKWCGNDVPAGMECRHDAMVPLYLLSAESGVPPITAEKGVSQLKNPRQLISSRTGTVFWGGSGTCIMPSPRCTKEQLLQILANQGELASKGFQQRWIQTNGMDTVETHDDAFELQVAPLVFGEDDDALRLPTYTDSIPANSAPSRGTVQHSVSSYILIMSVPCTILMLVVAHLALRVHKHFSCARELTEDFQDTLDCALTTTRGLILEPRSEPGEYSTVDVAHVEPSEVAEWMPHPMRTPVFVHHSNGGHGLEYDQHDLVLQPAELMSPSPPRPQNGAVRQTSTAGVGLLLPFKGCGAVVSSCGPISHGIRRSPGILSRCEAPPFICASPRPVSPQKSPSGSPQGSPLSSPRSSPRLPPSFLHTAYTRVL